MTLRRQTRKTNNYTSKAAGSGISTEASSGALFRHERLIVAGLCIAAAIRVFIFSAAFPFFNNVDEEYHFDMILKYSSGHLPSAAVEKFAPKSVDIISKNLTGEYLDFPTDRSPAGTAEAKAFYEERNNLETWVWPAYYSLAGLWCRIGETLNLSGVRLLYWIRFLNIPIAAAFVWITWLFCRRFLSANPNGPIAGAVLAAFFPQDIFFAMTADVLSPLVFAAAFFMLVEIYLHEKSLRYYLAAGLMVAITFLTKATNLVIVLFAAYVIIFKMIQAGRQKLFKQYIQLAVFAAAAVVPVALWIGRNYMLFGDFSGAAESMKERTWTVKPFYAIFDHPIFTLSGFFYFITELTKTFWRGEFTWHLKSLANPFMDWFYVICTAVFLIASIAGMLAGRKTMDSRDRIVREAAIFTVVLSVLLLAYLSMRYDFGECFYPSREKPYFTSGRLIAGVIMPFLFLFTDGLSRVLSRIGLGSYLPAAACGIAAAITASEIYLSLPAFACRYNFFHLI